MLNIIRDRIQQSVETKQGLLNDEHLLRTIEKVAELIISTYKSGGKVLWCGNGGSAADAQHLAAELSGRFYYDRPPLFSEALHVNTSYITAVANDYSYDLIYSRLVDAMARPGDVVIGLSTSGNSKNVVNALEKARNKGIATVSFSGNGGGRMKDFSDHLIAISSIDTPRIQECHMLIGHTVCELVESILFPRT